MARRINETPEEYAIRIAEHKARRGPSKKARKKHYEEVGRFEEMSPEEIYNNLCSIHENSESGSYVHTIAAMALSYIHRI